MSWKIVRRKFTALKFPKGSPDRYRLNKNSLTSEFARRQVWLVVNEQDKPLKSFETISDCKEFISNPDKFKPKRKVKKYTKDMYLNSKNYFGKKTASIKDSLNYG